METYEILINQISIVIPALNEEESIPSLVDELNAELESANLEFEIIIVDDCSTDKTKKIIESLANKNKIIRYFFLEKNLGKGSALKRGFKEATGDIILIQDADLEYDPKDYPLLIKPFQETDADIVYGSRFLGGEYVRLHFFWHYLANRLLTLATNIITNLNMTDMETGYKVFKRDVIQSIEIKEKSFGVEPEITVKLAKKKFIFFNFRFIFIIGYWYSNI